jgi:hypothetical protein
MFFVLPALSVKAEPTIFFVAHGHLTPIILEGMLLSQKLISNLKGTIVIAITIAQEEDLFVAACLENHSFARKNNRRGYCKLERGDSTVL